MTSYPGPQCSEGFYWMLKLRAGFWDGWGSRNGHLFHLFLAWNPKTFFFRSDNTELEFIFKLLEHCTFPEYACGTATESHTCIW